MRLIYVYKLYTIRIQFCVHFVLRFVYNAVYILYTSRIQVVYTD